MVNLIAGIILLLITLVLCIWARPRNGEPTRIPDKWGMAMLFPVAVLGLSIAGVMLIATTIYL
jgi:hypothetical protein